MSSSLMSRELVFLILQFLDEEKFKDTVHMLEKESGFFFNMRYFEDAVTNGKWDDVEKYLSGFTKVEDNTYSTEIFFRIRKQKYFEALDKQDRAKAVEILRKDLKVFSTFSLDIEGITFLLTLDNIREDEKLSNYGDTQSARAFRLVELKQLIVANPVFHDKLQFPFLSNSRLQTLVSQSLNWQHQFCQNPDPNPEIKTLFVDHTCGQPNGAQAPSLVANRLMAMPKVGGFPPLRAHGPSQQALGPIPLATSSVFAGPIGRTPSNEVMVKRPRIPPPSNLAMDYQTADYSKHVLKRDKSKRPVSSPASVQQTIPRRVPIVTNLEEEDTEEARAKGRKYKVKPWAVKFIHGDESPVMNDESLVKDPSLGESLLAGVALPQDMLMEKPAEKWSEFFFYVAQVAQLGFHFRHLFEFLKEDADKEEEKLKKALLDVDKANAESKRLATEVEMMKSQKEMATKYHNDVLALKARVDHLEQEKEKIMANGKAELERKMAEAKAELERQVAESGKRSG